MADRRRIDSNLELGSEPSSRRIFQPGLRQTFSALYDCLLGVCAWYWFGSSGLGLLLLWRLARRERPLPRVTDWRVLVASEQLRFVHLTPWRVLLVGQGRQRCEVYRDELGEEDWARLRRLCIGRQPATGRSTSS